MTIDCCCVHWHLRFCVRSSFSSLGYKLGVEFLGHRPVVIPCSYAPARIQDGCQWIWVCFSVSVLLSGSLSSANHWYLNPWIRLNFRELQIQGTAGCREISSRVWNEVCLTGDWVIFIYYVTFLLYLKATLYLCRGIRYYQNPFQRKAILMCSPCPVVFFL